MLIREQIRCITLLLVAIVALGACKGSSREVVVYTSVDQPISEPVFRDFEKTSGIAVRTVFDTEETKSTGVLNRLIAESGNPQADVFWSGDPVRAALLAKRGLAQSYVAENAAGIPPEFKASDGAWTGFAARARVLIVNKNLVKTDLPSSVRDLADPRWKDRASMANPLFGTTTMHMAALFTKWGDDKTREFLNQLKANGVRIASSNGEVKRLVASGEVAFGLADTDDADEAIKDGAPVSVVYPDQDGLGTLVMPTATVLINKAPHREPGQQLINYLLSADVERRLAETAAHIPLRPGVETPPDVRSVSHIRAMQVDYAKVAADMDRIQPWLRAWVGL
jgi:iron(III) transport system substrate-binding protein